MRKLHIASLFASIGIWWGVEKIQANLSLWLTNLGYRFTHLVLEDKQPRNEYAGPIHSFATPFIVWFGVKKIFSLFSLARQVKKYCAQHMVDVLIGQWDFFFMVTWLSKLFGNKTRCIAMVHTSIWVRHPRVNRVLRYFLKLHDVLVMTSHQEMDTFITLYKFPQEKLYLIYNAVDIGSLTNQAKTPLSPDYEALFVRGKKNFINVARLNYQKNQQLLINAFAALDDTDTQLLLVWEGDERGDITDLIKKLWLTDRIHLLGNQTNPHQFVARADYWVLSSRFEGFPVVLIEGWALWKPIIAIDCPTWPREFLDPNRKVDEITDSFVTTAHGLLVKFDEHSITHLTEAMNYVLTHDTKQMQSAVQKYCQRFDNSENAKKWDILIQSLDN